MHMFEIMNFNMNFNYFVFIFVNMGPCWKISQSVTTSKPFKGFLQSKVLHAPCGVLAFVKFPLPKILKLLLLLQILTFGSHFCPNSGPYKCWLCFLKLLQKVNFILLLMAE